MVGFEPCRLLLLFSSMPDLFHMLAYDYQENRVRLAMQYKYHALQLHNCVRTLVSEGVDVTEDAVLHILQVSRCLREQK